MQGHTCYICLAFLQCVFQMCPKMAWPGGCKVTKVAFIRFFSTVHFKMCFQIVRPREGIFALVAFFGFSSLCIFKWIFKSPAIAWFGSICLTFIYDVYSNGLSPVCKSLWSFKTGVLVEYLSQFLQCLHWKGLLSANAPMCIFKSFSLEKVLALSSHAESPFPVCSDHVNLQTLPTWEKFCTTSATVKTLSNFYAVPVKNV